MNVLFSSKEYDFHTLIKVAEIAGLAGVVSFHQAGDDYLVTLTLLMGTALGGPLFFCFIHIILSVVRRAWWSSGGRAAYPWGNCW